METSKLGNRFLRQLPHNCDRTAFQPKFLSQFNSSIRDAVVDVTLEISPRFSAFVFFEIPLTNV